MKSIYTYMYVYIYFPFGLQASAQSTEPHKSGLYVYIYFPYVPYAKQILFEWKKTKKGAMRTK